MKEKALDNKCPSCGAPLKYNAKTKNFKCEYCSSEYTLEELKKYNNASNEKNNEEDGAKKVEKSKDGKTYVTYLCKNCNAEIIADENTAATFCVYCGSTAILKDKLSGEFAPSKIIPFKKDKSVAIEAFTNLSKGRPLVPKCFTSKENIEKITGVYIPFWLYNIKVSGELQAKSTNVTTWRSGNYTYTKTDIYGYDCDGEMTFEGVPVDGSSRFENDIMNAIEPFNYDELEKYNHAYLSGFLAEKYDVPKDEAVEDANKRALKSTTDKMLSDMKGVGIKTVTNSTLAPQTIKTEYALLPVWMVNVKYKDKYYIFAMNGQTGEFVGNIPLDKRKAIIYFILILIAVFAVIMAISILIFKVR